MQIHFHFYNDDNIRQESTQIKRKKWNPMLPQLLQEHGNVCYLCNEIMIVGTDRLQVDHMIPLSFGGQDEYHNLRPTHAPCNHYRQDLMLNDTRLPEQIEKAKAQIKAMRENPDQKLCLECQCDISNLAPQAWFCKSCIEIRKKAQLCDHLAKPENRERKKARNRVYRANPEVRAKENARQRARNRVYRANPEYRAKENARQRARYRARMANPEYRAKKNALARALYHAQKKQDA